MAIRILIPILWTMTLILLQLDKFVLSNQAPISMTVTGSSMKNSRLNLCLNLGNPKQPCNLRYAVANAPLDEPYSPRALNGPVSLTITGGHMVSSVLNICIIEGGNNTDCIIRSSPSKEELDEVSSSIDGLGLPQVLKGPIRVTFVGSVMSGSIINFYLVDENASYTCIINGISKSFCTIRSISSTPPINGLAFSPKTNGPITISITGGSFDGKNQNICINTGGSTYICSITGNNFGYCTDTGSTECN